MSQKFQKKVEDFICEHCGTKVVGSGYTNHCPQCLWSKHVDINPGDRAAKCGGLMLPVDVVFEHGQQNLIQQCQTCGRQKKNELASNDNMEEVFKVIKSKV